MKNLLLLVFTITMVSCVNNNSNQETESAKQTLDEQYGADNASPYESDSQRLAFEKAGVVMVGGKGVTFEKDSNGETEMCFDIDAVERTTQQINDLLKKMETEFQYDTPKEKESAIDAAKQNLKIVQGTFCCTTHNGQHCDDVSNLKELNQQYGCEIFKKKK